jgi:hypothetical protein
MKSVEMLGNSFTTSEMYEASGNRVLGLTIVEHVDFQSWLVNSDITHKLLRLIGKIGFVNSQKSIKGFVHLLILSLSNKEYFVCGPKGKVTDKD